jgi:hypothetical protein
VNILKHKLKISVSKRPQTGGIVRLKNITLREKILRYLLGEKQRLMILIPGDSVESLSINEVSEKVDESNEE